MLSQDSEEEIDQDLRLNLRYDFGKMNSTLGSVVPLAMFKSYCCFSAHSIFILLFLVTRSTHEKSTQTICQAQASGSYSVHMGQARVMDNHLHHLPQSANIRIMLSTKIGSKGQRKNTYSIYSL